MTEDIKDKDDFGDVDEDTLLIAGGELIGSNLGSNKTAAKIQMSPNIERE